METLEDRRLLAAELVSVTPPPDPDPPEAGNDYSVNPAISAGGRYVAFQSHADNLARGIADTNATQDVFVRDLLTQETVLISRNFQATDSGSCEVLGLCGGSVTDGSFDPDISQDGRFVVFVSNATDLVSDSGLTFLTQPNVYVHDRDSDEDGVLDELGETSTTLLSRNEDGDAVGAERRPVISGDGKYVAFSSAGAIGLAEDSVPDTNGAGEDIFLANIATGDIRLVTINPTGTGSGLAASIGDFSIDGDGNAVALSTTNAGLTSGLVPGGVPDTNLAGADIFVGDGQNPVELVTINAAETGTPSNVGGVLSRQPAISRDGRHVAYISRATDLVPGATDENIEEDIFVRDLKLDTTALVSQSRQVTPLSTGDRGSPGNVLGREVGGPAISDDGRFIVFVSEATDLLDLDIANPVTDENDVPDVFRFDRDTDEDGVFDEPGETATTLVSVNFDGTASTGHEGFSLGLASSFAPSISGDGRFVAFASTGSELVEGLSGTNVFVRDMMTGVTSLVSDSTSASGGGANGTSSAATTIAVISRDGSRIAFQSDTDAQTLDPNVTDPASGTAGIDIDVFAGTPQADIVASSNFARGFTQLDQSFRVRFEDVTPFEFGFYQSNDAVLGGSDVLLGTSPVTDSGDLVADGPRILSTTIGTGPGQVALPGVGSVDSLDDYYILAVADHLDDVDEFDADPFNDDNTRAVRGLYHVSGGPVFVHGVDGPATGGVESLAQIGNETVTATVTGQTLAVEYGPTGFSVLSPFEYSTADVTELRIRLHGGDDTVNGSDLPEIAFGGDGADLLSGNGGDDRLEGGPGPDRLLGGGGADWLDGGPGTDTLLGGAGPDTLVDGPGDDLLDAGPDDDIVFALPGSDNIYIGGDGEDTLNLSLHTLDFSLDLDSTAKQTVDDQGNTVQVSGFEHYVGSSHADHLTVRPLPGVDRRIDGGGGQNTLRVDAGGNTVVNDGSRLSFPGTTLGDLIYENFLDIIVTDGFPQVPIVDDGDDGFSSTGFDDPASTEGFQDDLLVADPNDATSSIATWTFDGLAPGFYAVAATWTADPGRATDTPYQIFTDGVLRQEIRVDQQIAPQEFVDQDVSWRNLGVVRVHGSSLAVDVTDDADGIVAADAIRLEPISETTIVDDEPAVGGKIVHRGSGTPLSLLAAISTFNNRLGGENNGDLAGSQGTGRRSVDWEDINEFTAASPLPSDSYRTRGISITSPGEFRVSGTGSFGLGTHFQNLNASYLTAFSGLSAPGRIASPVDSNVTDIRFFIPGTDVAAGVRGFAAAFTDVDLALTSKIEFFDANDQLFDTEFAEPAAGNGEFSFLGVTYDDPVIARVRITSGQAPLLLTGSPDDVTQGGDDDVSAFDDIIYGEPVPAVIPGGGGVSDVFTSNCTAIAGPGFQADQHDCQPGQLAQWAFPNTAAGTYLVSATWTSGPSQSSSARYTINNDGDETEVNVDQQNPPSGGQQAGLPWQPLAKIQVAEGTVPVVTLNDGSGNVIADAVDLRPAPDLELLDFESSDVPNGGTYDFGSVPLSDQGDGNRTRRFTVRNHVSSASLSLEDHHAPLRLSNLQVVGDGFSVSPFDATELPPGASTTFDVIFGGDALGQFGGQVMFSSNDFARPFMAFDVVAEVVADTTPPTVEISSPDGGARFIEGTTTDLMGIVRDNLAAGEKIMVSLAGQTVEADPDGKFTLRDVSVSETLAIQAIDTAGNVGQAQLELDIIPNQPPSIEIVQPPDGQSFIGSTVVRLQIDASDDVRVQRVELFDNDVAQQVLAFYPPLTIEVELTDAGQHDLKVCALDDADLMMCDTVTVTIFSEDSRLDFDSIVTGSDAGGSDEVQVFQADGTQTFRFTPYPGFNGGVRVATGDVNGDGIPDLITGAGVGDRPQVKVINGASGQEIRSIFAFESEFVGGVYVGSGDINGDGFDDVIVGPGADGPSELVVFDGLMGDEIARFAAFGAAFSGGVRVASGDVNGDGQDDIIAAAGVGGGPHVRVFDGHTSSQLPAGGDVPDEQIAASFFAFSDAFAGGVFVAAGDVNSDGLDDIIVGADQDGSDPGGHVRVVDAARLDDIIDEQEVAPQQLLSEFFAFDRSFAGGARVASGDVNRDGIDEIIVGTGPGIAPDVNLFDGAGIRIIDSIDLEAGDFQGIFVAGASEPTVDVVNLPPSGGITTVAIEGSDLVVRDAAGNEIARKAADSTNKTRLNGGPLDDLLIIRGLGQQPELKDLIFDGGLGGNDALQLDPSGTSGLPLDYLRMKFADVLTTYISTDRSPAARATVTAIDLEPIEDNMEVVDRQFDFADTDDVVTFDTQVGGMESVLRIDSDHSEQVDFLQPSGMISVNLGGGSDDFRFALTIDLLPTVDGQEGSDTLTLAGSGNHLDLTDPSGNRPLNIERIDIIGDSPNELTIDEPSVVDTTDTGNMLIVVHDDDDTVNYVGDDWEVQTPIFVDGGQRHLLTAGEARVETVNALPWQNPLEPTDVNLSGDTTSLDALQIINFLGRHESTPVPLPTPTSEGELPERYYDVNGSRTATALDALRVINFLGRQLLGDGEFVAVAPEVVTPTARPAASSAGRDKANGLQHEEGLLAADARDVAIQESMWVTPDGGHLDAAEEALAGANPAVAPDADDEKLASLDQALKDLLPAISGSAF